MKEAEGRKTEKGVGWEGEERRREEGGCRKGTVTHADRLYSLLIGHSDCQSEELGVRHC